MNSYLNSILKELQYYKRLGEKTLAQLPSEKWFWQPHPESNSIAIIINHLHGNMCSRWTQIFTNDGEKAGRNREEEFENTLSTKKEVLSKWNEGWNTLFHTLNGLNATQLEKILYIRNEGHTLTSALNRQLAHYAYHIGQIVYIGKMLQNQNWKSLSIAKGGSQEFNQRKFAQPKRNAHFTDDNS